MKKLLIFIGIVFYIQQGVSQEHSNKVEDSLYREDQFYIGVTYNLLGKIPANLSQSGFSSGFHMGFIRDIPINKNRNFAIGIGLGLSANSFNQNLLINKDNLNNTIYSILNDRDTYTKNKFSVNLIEFPIEFRWRTSTPTEYKFWRIYTGFKFGYAFAHGAKHNGDLGDIKHSDIADFNDIQYGLTLSVGYNTWNIYIYYTLNPIFSKNTRLNGDTLDINAIKVGLMFYIL